METQIKTTLPTRVAELIPEGCKDYWVITVREDGVFYIRNHDEQWAQTHIKPYESLLKTVWNVISSFDFSEESPKPLIVIHYIGHFYVWDDTLAHYCFAKGSLSEQDFMKAIHFKLNGEGE